MKSLCIHASGMTQIGPCYQVIKTHYGWNQGETDYKAIIIETEGRKGGKEGRAAVTEISRTWYCVTKDLDLAIETKVTVLLQF